MYRDARARAKFRLALHFQSRRVVRKYIPRRIPRDEHIPRFFPPRRRAQRDSNSRVSHEQRVFPSRRSRATIMSLIRGRSFRLGSPFPGRETTAERNTAELRSCYDVGDTASLYYRRGSSKEFTPADNTRFPAAPRLRPKCPSRPPGSRKIPGAKPGRSRL